jgi:diacylglycerol kinase (CTP)
VNSHTPSPLLRSPSKISHAGTSAYQAAHGAAHRAVMSPAGVGSGVRAPATGAVRLQLRSDLHLARKAWHMIMGLVVAGLYYFTGMERSTAILLLGSVLGFDLLIETARLRIPSLNEKVMRAWKPFMRSCEANRISGVPYYLSSSILSIAIFPLPIAVLSIIYLACGDPMSSLIGIQYGSLGPRFSNGKSLIGTAAGVITCWIVGFVFLSLYGMTGSALWILTLVGGLAGGTAEMLPLEVDDNFSIPTVSGFVLWAAFILMGL